MKKRKTCVFSAIVLLVCMLLGVFSGCNEHEHNFTWYISKQPTCTEDGTLEGICDCGKKVFENIEASHNLDENGECIICGDSGSVIEDGQVLGYNAEKIYQKLVSYGFNGSFDQFKGEIKNYRVTEIKIDSFGTVRVVLSAYGQEAPVFLLNQKIEFKVAVLNQLRYVLRLEINENGILKCTLSDGTALDLGGVEGITPSSSKTVRSLFINQDNLLIVTYSDNSFKVIGKIALEGTKIDGAEFIYEKISGKSEYAITGVLNKNLQQIEIPATHRGLPITEIAEWAFYKNKNVTKVVLGENIRKIGEFAFTYCENLQTVVLNEGLEQIDDWCFSDCKKLSRIVIPESVSYISASAFAGTNCYVYACVETKPANWNFSGVQIYWAGEWDYMNGIPTRK